MRKQALACAAALAVGIVSSMAQNVYSLNVVGYYNITVPADSYKMIANQFNTTNNTIAALLPTPPDFTELYKWVSGGYVFYQYDGGWAPDGNATLNPGEGAFIKNVTTSPLTLTFVGEVPQGALANPMGAGYSIRSSMVPQAGGVTSVLNFTPGDFDEIYTWNNGYTFYQFDGGWAPSEPTVAVGEAFFVNKAAAGTWTRNFTVN